MLKGTANGGITPTQKLTLSAPERDGRRPPSAAASLSKAGRSSGLVWRITPAIVPPNRFRFSPPILGVRIERANFAKRVVVGSIE